MRRLVIQRSDGRKLFLGAVRSGEEEFGPGEPDHDLFSGPVDALSWEELERTLPGARMTGERRFDLALWLIAAVLFLLPLDVALRRVNT